MSINFDWEHEEREREKRQAADEHYQELQALKRRRLRVAILSFVGLLALIGLIIVVRQKIAEQEVQNEFEQTINGEIQAIRVSDKSAFLGYQENVNPWFERQWNAFDEYKRESGHIVAGDQILDSQSDGAHGRAVLQELVDGKPYQVTWFYAYGQDGWKHVAPPAAYWGAAEHLSGDHFDIDYLSLDAEQVSAMQIQLDEWWQTACKLTACGSGGPGRINVHVNFDLQLTPRWSPDDLSVLELPSPHLRRVPADGTLDPAFKQDLARLLAEHWARWAVPVSTDSTVDAVWLQDELATWLAHEIGADPTAPLLGPLASRSGPQAVMALAGKIKSGEGAIPALGEVSGADPLDPAFDWQDYLATELRAEAALVAAGKAGDAAQQYGDPDHPWQAGVLPPMSPGSIQVTGVAKSGDITWAQVTFTRLDGGADAPQMAAFIPFRIVEEQWRHSRAQPVDFGPMQDRRTAHVLLHVSALDAQSVGGLEDDLEADFTKASSDLGIKPEEIGGLDITIAPSETADDPWTVETPPSFETGDTPATPAISVASPYLLTRPASQSVRETVRGQIALDMLIRMIRFRAYTINPRAPLLVAFAQWELARLNVDADTFLPVDNPLSDADSGTLDRLWMHTHGGPFVLEDAIGARVLIDMLVSDHGPEAVSALLTNLVDAKDADDWLSKSLNVRVADIETRWASATQVAINSFTGGHAVPVTALSSATQGESDGPIDVMMSDSGKTISLKVGQSFRLNLNPNPDLFWSVEIADPSVIALSHQVYAATGAQWTYVASKAGRTSLTATGYYVCKYSPGVTCSTDKLLFQWEIVVH